MDNPTYYEKFDWKESHLDIRLRHKIQKILETIPADVITIVDIGCGDGTITNELAKKYKITGVDRSKSALSFVKTKKILSSSEKIDVPDKSFDMVFSSELLEHLTDKVFCGTIMEMKRISKKYIFLTVPNKEVLGKDFIQCPKCGWIFNRAYHLRSLDIAKLKKYFSDFSLIRSFTFGSGKRGYNKLLLKIKHRFVPASAWIPKYWTRNSSRKTMCQKCGAKFTYHYKFNLLGSLCDFLNIFLSPHKPYWLFILLEKGV